MIKLNCLLIFLIVILLSSFAIASDKIIVGVKPLSPIILPIEQGKYVGFGIDVWEAIAEEADIDYKYYETSTLPYLFSLLNSGTVDVALGGITITSHRDTLVDFSYPYLKTGLSIVIPTQEKVTSFYALILKMCTNPNILRPVLMFFISIIILAHIFYFVEVRDISYISGILTYIYYCFVVVSTVGLGDITPKKALGKFVTVCLILYGIAFFGYVIGLFVTELTKDATYYNISAPKHLTNKKVATIENSTSVDVLSDLGAITMSYSDLDEALLALKKNKVVAVVFDTPNVMYSLKTKNDFVISGSFEPQDYGIAVKKGNPLRNKINNALLKIKEKGVYSRIYEKWFDGEAIKANN